MKYCILIAGFYLLFSLINLTCTVSVLVVQTGYAGML